ncbi:cyclase family protein [Actinomadura sp. LD22]|uniref:Cyclase family protein n=1 Tax=Actinomadura physcomitrii TaxID=2650748 RepID=A0A6I4MFB3_9ACTN|nr:cyclase family protein [Actinomadura physcomitrii]MWA02914.1 cyclase family protein [Actinomadura physcomitrii]
MAHGNWGRWGSEDQRGALNLVDESARRRGVAAMRRALPVSLGLPLRAGAAPHAAIRPDVQHLMLRDGGDYAAGLPERPGLGYADDMLIVACHGTTHLDALAHVWRDGLMYNGFPATEVTSRGARKAGIETVGPVVTRAFFLDLPRDDGSPIGAADVEAAVAATGARPEPGDALLIRTGWLARWRAGTASKTTWPGIDRSVVDLVDRWGIALVGADNISVEVEPSGDPGCTLPLHVALIRDRGVFLLELLDLERLAELSATTFLLVVSPLNIVGGSASPVAPTAVL